MKKDDSILPIAILLYTSWGALSLVSYWFTSPPDQYGWLAFLIWCFPILVYASRHKCHPIILCLAILTSLMGTLGSMNTLKQLGLSFALAAFIPWSWNLVPWIICAISWMPMLGWITINHTPFNTLWIRLIMAISSSLWVMDYMWRKKWDS